MFRYILLTASLLFGCTTKTDKCNEDVEQLKDNLRKQTLAASQYAYSVCRDANSKSEVWDNFKNKKNFDVYWSEFVFLSLGRVLILRDPSRVENARGLHYSSAATYDLNSADDKRFLISEIWRFMCGDNPSEVKHD